MARSLTALLRLAYVGVVHGVVVNPRFNRRLRVRCSTAASSNVFLFIWTMGSATIMDELDQLSFGDTQRSCRCHRLLLNRMLA